MSINKSGLSSKFQKAKWNLGIYRPSEVRHELEKLVNDDIRYWILRNIPPKTSFAQYGKMHTNVLAIKPFERDY